MAVQLARRRGATVIGTASPANHAFLRGLGVIPVEYGDGLADRIRAVAPQGVDAYIDTHGTGNVQVAIALGVERDRIDTIIDFHLVDELGVLSEGQAAAEPRPVVAALAELIADGEIVAPILARFPLDRVAEVYDRLGRRHGLGKVVLDVSAPPGR